MILYTKQSLKKRGWIEYETRRVGFKSNEVTEFILTFHPSTLVPPPARKERDEQPESDGWIQDAVQ
jgi:hypothetical protein